jgi:hypothetical protein
MIKKWLWDHLMDKALKQQAFSNKARIIAKDMEATAKSLEHNAVAEKRFLGAGVHALKVSLKHAKRAVLWAKLARLIKPKE